MQLLSLREVAKRLNISPKTLGDKRYRARIGLPAVRVGGTVGFEEEEVDQVIIRGRQQRQAQEASRG